MLQSMRNLSQNIIFKALMGLLLVSFSIWGIGDIFRGNALRREVARVGKITISVQALESEFQKNMREVHKILGPEMTAQKARQIGLLDRALNMMMADIAYDQGVAHMGLRVNDRYVLDRIAAMEQFRDKDGNFNRDAWNAVLRQNNMSERQLVDAQKKQEARKLIFLSMMSNAVPPKTMVDHLYKARGQKRIFEIVSLANSSVGNIPAPDAATLEDFYKQKSDQFVAEEYRGVTIAKLSWADAVKDIAIKDEDLEEAYTARKESFFKPEQRDLVQVVLQDEEKAKMISGVAAKDKDLARAAKEKGFNAIPIDKAEETGALSELYGAVFKLSEKDVSQPIKTSLGWHVVQVKKVYPARQPELSEVKNTLREQIKQEQAAEIVTRLVNKLDDALAAGQPLEEVADSLSLRLIKIPAMTTQGLTPEKKEPKELPAKADVLRVAFEQASGETSQVIEDRFENGSDYIVVRTDEVTPSRTLSFDEVKMKVLSLWQTNEQAQKAADMAEKMATSLREGGKASSLAVKAGVDVRLSKPVTLLGDADRDIPKNAMDKVFMMKRGDVVVVPNGDRQLILRLADIDAVDPAKPEAGYHKVSADLEEKLPGDFLEGYSSYLRYLFPVKVNAKVLQMMRSQGE